MGSNNTKVDGKYVNINKIKNKKGPTTSTITKDAYFPASFPPQTETFGEINDIIVPRKRIFTNENDYTTVADFSKGLSENKKVDEYNDTLYTERDPASDQIILLGPKVLVRMLRLKLYNKNGMWTGGRTHEVLSKSEMRKNIEQLPDNMQFQDRAVVLQVSDNCSDWFKEKVVPGTIVEVDPTAFNPGRMQRWLHKDNVTNSFDNYFILPEFIIENIVDMGVNE